jgi:hypothetical protein
VTERWLPVHGFPGYEVSDLGRVRSWHPQSYNARARTEPRVLRPGTDGRSGYLAVSLRRDGVSFCRRVHVLVLETFVGPRPTGLVARHTPDPSVANNRLNNLSWGTPKENSQDMVSAGRSCRGDRHWTRTMPELRCAGDRHGRRKLSGHQVTEARRRHADGATTAELASDYGVSWFSMNGIVRRKFWRHLP